MNAQRSDDSLDHFSRRRSAKDLLHLKDDDSGCIEGRVFMVWPPRNGLHRVNLEVAEDSALYRFEVEVPHKDGIAFRPHERVSFALKGTRVDRRKESSSPSYFPIVLRFPDSVVFKYLTGANAGKVVHAWKGNSDEWYNPGMVQTVSDAVTIDASKIHHDPLPTSEIERTVRPPPRSTAVTDCAATPQLIQPAQPTADRLGRSTKRPRKKRRLQKGKETMCPTNRSGPGDFAMICDERPKTTPGDSSACVSGNYIASNQVAGNVNTEVSIREDVGVDLPRESHNDTTTAQSTNVSALQLKAGVRTQRGDIFTALDDLKKCYSLVNVIGIVTSVNQEKKTRTNEWGRSFTLADPSTLDSTRQSITVNCFQKKYLEWLPQVRKDDIVILRRLKVVEFNGVISTTGYSDKLRWAVYDSLNHSIRDPNKGHAPEKVLVDDGMGYEFSPYWEPLQDSIELEYCRKIGEWWNARREFEGPSTVECSAPPRKRHLLISEASPDLPPQGFFNCTVEVLQKLNHDALTVVYVTDYTVNTLVHSVQAAWCPLELSDCVLQCAMWDDARNIAKMMNPGEYWYLHNVRAKWNPSNYMEGTLQLAEKVTQVYETNIDTQPHLRTLLERKKEFELNKSNLCSGSSWHVFPDMLLQDVDGSTSFLTCNVELIHIDLCSRDGHFMYVTDYTYNPDLPTTVSTFDWAYNLEHRIMKIKLDDNQAKNLSNLNPGSMYTIRNLRIRRLDASGSMHGCLGGEDTLVVSLSDSSSHHTQTLQTNKENWKRENMLNAQGTLQNVSHEVAHGPPGQSSTTLDDITLREALTRSAPSVFRVVARTTDFFPFSLDDASLLRCTKCNSSPPPSFKQCPRCDDMMETHSRWFYRLYILLQDNNGGELIVSLSGKECTLLQDVDATDFRCDQEAYSRLLMRLDPILGNLRDVHAAWSRNENKAIESPLMEFTLESWNVGDEKGYGLLDCSPA